MGLLDDLRKKAQAVGDFGNKVVSTAEQGAGSLLSSLRAKAAAQQTAPQMSVATPPQPQMSVAPKAPIVQKPIVKGPMSIAPKASSNVVVKKPSTLDLKALSNLPVNSGLNIGGLKLTGGWQPQLPADNTITEAQRAEAKKAGLSITGGAPANPQAQAVVSAISQIPGNIYQGFKTYGQGVGNAIAMPAIVNEVGNAQQRNDIMASDAAAKIKAIQKQQEKDRKAGKLTKAQEEKNSKLIAIHQGTIDFANRQQANSVGDITGDYSTTTEEAQQKLIGATGTVVGTLGGLGGVVPATAGAVFQAGANAYSEGASPTEIATRTLASAPYAFLANKIPGGGSVLSRIGTQTALNTAQALTDQALSSKAGHTGQDFLTTGIVSGLTSAALGAAGEGIHAAAPHISEGVQQAAKDQRGFARIPFMADAADAAAFKKLNDAVKNSTAFRKEGMVSDKLGEGILMEKNGRHVIAVGDAKQKYYQQGYKMLDSVDTMAMNMGFDSGHELLQHAVDDQKVGKTLQAHAKAYDAQVEHQYKEHVILNNAIPENDPLKRLLNITGNESLDRVLTRSAKHSDPKDVYGAIHDTYSDELTGLLGQKFYKQSKMDQAPQVFLDIDNFGNFNAKYSQTTGNDVLKLFGKLIEKHFPGKGIRAGGEEFFIDPSGISHEDMVARLQALRDDMMSQEFTVREGKSKGEVVKDINFTTGFGDNETTASEAMKVQKKAQKGVDNIDPVLYNNSNNAPQYGNPTIQTNPRTEGYNETQPAYSGGTSSTLPRPILREEGNAKSIRGGKNTPVLEKPSANLPVPGNIPPNQTATAQSQTSQEPQTQTLGLQGPQKRGSFPVVENQNAYKPNLAQARKNAIAETATQVKEKPSTVKRVTDKIGNIKTDVIEYVQNSQERVRQLSEGKIFKTTDEANPYQKMILYHGRVGSKMETMQENVQAILNDMQSVAKETKTDIGSIRKSVSDYLLYRHAPERNTAIGEKAAGISTAEANTKRAALEALPHGEQIKKLADKVQAINNGTLELLHDTGVISDELFTTLRERYKNHVPLNRIMEHDEDVGSILTGKGFNVRSTGVKAAKGSELEVNDILGNVMTNYEQAVLRSEKNIVDQATLNFVRNNKDILDGQMEEYHPRAVGKTFDGKPIMETTTDPRVLQMYENGKRVWIKIRDPKLAIAFQGVDREKLPVILNAVGSFTRLYAGLATRFNPEFAIPNKIRDLQETAVYLASQKGVGFKGAARTVARDPKSMMDILDHLRGKDTKGARLYQEMKDAGGTTGGFGLSNRKQTDINLQKLESLAASPTKKVVHNLIEGIDNWNALFEDSTRLSVYKSARERGLSKDRAAFLAKEASINFNTMGKGGPVINAIYMFSNASLQGSAKMVRSLKNPKVLGSVVAAVGASVAAANQWNDTVDKDWRDKVSKWDRMNGLTIAYPSTDGQFRYFTIPVSWGLKPIKVMSDYAYDGATGDKNFDVKSMMGDTTTAMVEAYNPVGGTDLVSALTPTLLDTPVELARNQSWSGSKIRPDYDKNAPADVQYFSSLGNTAEGRTAISISELLQSKAGIAVSPADIKYAFEQYTGGAGRAATRATNLTFGGTESAISGKNKLPPVDEWPLISRFYRERTAEEIGKGGTGDPKLDQALQEQSRQNFKAKQTVDKVYEEILALPKGQARIDYIKKFIQEHPEDAKRLNDTIKKKALDRTFEDTKISQLQVQNGARARYIYDNIKDESKEHKQAILSDLVKKKLLTEEVAAQIGDLMQQ